MRSAPPTERSSQCSRDTVRPVSLRSVAAAVAMRIAPPSEIVLHCAKRLPMREPLGAVEDLVEVLILQIGVVEPAADQQLVDDAHVGERAQAVGRVAALFVVGAVLRDVLDDAEGAVDA